jgi:hypothetical protein
MPWWRCSPTCTSDYCAEPRLPGVVAQQSLAGLRSQAPIERPTGRFAHSVRGYREEMTHHGGVEEDGEEMTTALEILGGLQ